jgi:glutathione synthase/RimK-type ligase-like ATP-grasp enzyme
VVLVLADGDDVGVSRLVSALARRLPVTWWRFGLPESSISVQLDGAGFELDQPGAVLRSSHIHDAPIVIYRRRLMQPRPLVVSDLAAAEDRGFSEREWASLIEGALLAAERAGSSIWLNSPSSTLLSANKLALLLHAVRAGLPVPAFSASTPVCFPSTAGRQLVAKSISADEQIDVSRFFSTALLSNEDLRALPGTRLPAPSFLQEYVQAGTELRVFYILGEFFALALTSSRDHVDLRYEPSANLAPKTHQLAPALRDALAGVARAFALGYCTFDLLVPADGEPVLIDVTPNGDWDYFESDAAPVVTEFLAEAIVTRAARASRGR